MRRLQRLWGSVSVLTAAVLAGICFLSGNAQHIFLIGVFALWIAYSFAVFLMPVIKRYKYRRNLRKIRKNRKITAEVTAQNCKGFITCFYAMQTIG